MEEIVELITPSGGTLREVHDEKGHRWYVAKDVCEALCLKNVSDTCRKLDDDEKSTIVISDSTSGNPNTLIISLEGVIRLATRSQKEVAKAFSRWMIHKLTAPVVRGEKMLVDAPKAVQQQLDFSPRVVGIINELDRQLGAVEKEKERLEIGLDVLLDKTSEFQRQAEVNQPYVEHSLAIQKSVTLFTSEEIAKNPRINLPSAFALNKLLEAMGIIFSRSKRRKKWQLYADFIDKGWHGYASFDSITTDRETGAPVVHTYKYLRWTEKFLFALPGLIEEYNLKCAKGKDANG